MPKRTYHHGDLRRALLDGALRILRTDGPRGLTLRAVAREAGVSHQAPYHHFADRAALIAAVAEEGFQRLAKQVDRARRAAADPVRALQAGGVAYVMFAVRYPSLFRVMFGPELADRSSHPELAAAARRAFHQLTIADGAGSLALARIPPAVEATLWASVHGLAMLLIDGQLPGHRGGRAAERLALEVTEGVWFGLQASAVRQRGPH